METTAKNAKNAKFDAVKFLIERSVDHQLAADFLAVRKAKRLPPTHTAFMALEREFRAAGLTFEAGIRLCAERCWGGFRATYVQEG